MSAVCSRAGVERPSGLFMHSVHVCECACVCVCKSDLACIPGHGLKAATSQAFILTRCLLESLIMQEPADHIQNCVKLTDKQTDRPLLLVLHLPLC